MCGSCPLNHPDYDRVLESRVTAWSNESVTTATRPLSQGKLSDLSHFAAAVERVTRKTVADYRANGWTWAQIGSALGCSKQAAQQRYSR